MKKILTILLSVLMVATMTGVNVFAEEAMPSTSGTVTYNNNTDGETDETDNFKESEDNKTTVDEYYSVIKAAGTDDGSIDYYVVVTWSRTNGRATAKGDTYHWDASKQMYERTSQENGLLNNTPATVEFTVTNYSNAKVNYEVTYANNDTAGYNTTEAASVKSEGSSETYSKTGTLANYITYLQDDGSTITNEGIENVDADENATKVTTTGEASYSHEHTAPTATYKGSVTLNANDMTKTAFTDQVVGTYTINITAAPVAKQTVSATVKNGEDTTLTAKPTPSGDNTKTTTVTFPKEIDALENGDTANLTVDATTLMDAVDNASFSVVTTNNKALGALDLTLKVNGETVSEFKDGDTSVPVIVDTYVAMGITDFGFNYNGAAFDVVDNKSDVDAANEVWYDSETGELVFCTTHFSTYVLEGSNNAYIEDNNTAYQLEDAIAAAKDQSYTITVLKDVDWSEKYTGSTGTEKKFDLTNDTLDLNGHKISTSHNNSDPSVSYIGDNFTIKNGTFEVNTNGASYGLYFGGHDDYGVNVNENVVLKDVTVIGGINCYGTAITMNNVTSTGTNYYSVWAEHNSTVVINSGAYSSTSTLGKAVFNTNGDDSLITINGGTITASNNDVVIAKNNVIFSATSTATCNKNPGDDYVAKPYGYVENNGVYTISKVYNYKVTYEQTGYSKFDSWSDVQTAVTADSSKVYINMHGLDSNKSDTYTALSDTTTIVAYGMTGIAIYNVGIPNMFATEANALKCFFTYESGTMTEYFKTESEADSCVSAHTGALKTAIE